MANVNFWNILRVLTINICNYRCSFCHNEGQQQLRIAKKQLRYADFKIVIDSLKDTSLKEIHFSGGEPFLNPDTIKMILYVNDNTGLEIGCATNTTFLTDEILKQLSQTRIKLNIQFPAANPEDFYRITKKDYFSNVSRKLQLLKEYGISFGLNHVIQTADMNFLASVVDHAVLHEVPLKLLPDINSPDSASVKTVVFPYLDGISFKKMDKGTGALKWWIKTTADREVQVMYIDSPCFYDDIDTCRAYGEIRLLPDLGLQSCIKGSAEADLTHEVCNNEPGLIKAKLSDLWNNFTSC